MEVNALLHPSNHWKVLIAYLPALLVVFLPAFSPKGVGFHEDTFSELDETLRASKLLFFVFSFCLGVCFPLLIDLISDIAREYATKSRKPLVFWVKQVMTLATILGPTLAYFLATVLGEGDKASGGEIMACFLAAQRLFLIPSFLLGIAESPSGIFSGWQMMTTIGVASLHSVLLPYWDHPGRTGTVFMVLTYILLTSGVSLVWSMVIRYGCMVFQSKDALPTEEKSTLIRLAPISLCCAATLRTLVLVQPLSQYDEVTISTLMLALCSFGAVNLIQPAKAETLDKLSKMIALSELKKSFVSYISHEIRTPLNAAVVGMSLVSDLLPLLPESARVEAGTAISQITEALDVAVEILNELLTYDKITSKLLTLEKTLENPVALVTSTLSMFQLQAQKKQIEFKLPTLECETAVQLSRRLVKIDLHKMKQVLRNFASNALKFTPTGGRITVQVGIVSRSSLGGSSRDLSNAGESFKSAASAGGDSRRRFSLSSKIGIQSDWFRVEVIDSGAGIAAENLPRIFKEIVQFDANKLQEGKGTGLGLFISSCIVELHEGRVGVKSEGLGRGCTFWFELPLLPRNDGDVERIPLSSASNSCVPSGKEPWTSCRSSPYLQEGHPRVATCGGGVGESSSLSTARTTATTAPKFNSRECSFNGSLHRSSSESLHRTDRLFCQVSEMHQNLRMASSSTNASSKCPDVKHQRRMLVVDDSLVSSKMMVALVTKLGAIADVAEDGVVAVEKVRQSMAENRPYDVVVMDNNMPRMSGPEACREMRALGFSNPVFGLTGDVTVLDREVFMTAGAMEVFSKPLNVEAFKTKLNDCLSQAADVVLFDS